tara:strand:- start:52 stop:273 length:222 start_codon:yes stop_codon:yes gene_type:complete
MESPTGTEKDITLNKWWLAKEIYRLLAWEMLCSVARGKQGIPIRVIDLCDMIGTSEEFYSKILYTVKNKLNEK